MNIEALKNKIAQLLMSPDKGPENLKELIELLHKGKDGDLLDSDALSMIEAVLNLSDLRVRDVMVPRAHMDVVYRDDPFEKVLPFVVASGHSRFPIVGDDKAEVIGIMLAKDLLQFCAQSEATFDMREVLRSAVYVPESKRLNVLLKELRINRNHMAIVIDEYGNAAGFVTIEDIIEQIIGEIEDEYDFDEGAYILKRRENHYTIKAHTRLEDFNEFFNVELLADNIDTIGGLVINALGCVPKRDESVEIESYKFTILRADSRKVQLMAIEKIIDDEAVEVSAE